MRISSKPTSKQHSKCNDEKPPQSSRVGRGRPRPAETLGSPQGAASFVRADDHWTSWSGRLRVMNYLFDCCIVWTARLFKGGYCKHFKRSRFTRFTRITQFTRLIRKRQIRQNHQKRTDSPESPDSLEPPDSPENKQIHQNRSIFPQPSWTFHGEFAQFSLSSVCVVCA